MSDIEIPAQLAPHAIATAAQIAEAMLDVPLPDWDDAFELIGQEYRDMLAVDFPHLSELQLDICMSALKQAVTHRMRALLFASMRPRGSA